MKKKIKQVIAILTVLLIIGIVFLTLYLAITGSRYFMASLFTMIALPVFIYVYVWLYHVFRG